MTTEKFWYAWIQVASIITTVFGILLTLFSHTPLFNFLHDPAYHTFFSDPIIARAIEPMQNWLFSIVGSVIAGWGFIMLYLVYIPLKRKEKWAWKTLLISTLLWFVLDTASSIYCGAWLNVCINWIYFLQFAAPLLMLKNTWAQSIKS